MLLKTHLIIKMLRRKFRGQPTKEQVWKEKIAEQLKIAVDCFDPATAKNPSQISILLDGCIPWEVKKHFQNLGWNVYTGEHFKDEKICQYTKIYMETGY